MRKLFISLVMVFGLLGAAHAEVTAGTVVDILKVGGVSSIAVSGETTVYSASFPLPKGEAFSWSFDFASDGDVDVKVELEQAYARPTTEGSADATVYVVPDNKTTEIISITDEVLHITAYAPNATPYARLKITGNSGNDASTTLTTAKFYVIKE